MIGESDWDSGVQRGVEERSLGQEGRLRSWEGFEGIAAIIDLYYATDFFRNKSSTPNAWKFEENFKVEMFQ
ncbi:hypothetical protein L7F22_031824, partial [Adiantum nelumboides]|nr:hypothetical protein [Adiantum nelumboides]